MSMRFRQAVLVAIAAVLVSAIGLVSANTARETKTALPPSPLSAYVLRAGRSLRFDDGVDADNEEERAWRDISSFKSKVRKIFSRKEGKVQLPKGVPDKVQLSVLKEIPNKAQRELLRAQQRALGLYPKALNVKTGVDISKLNDRVTTFDAWKKLGLGKVLPRDLETTMATDKFAAYLTYVKKFDDHSLRLGTPPLVNPEPTAAELTARAIALAIHKREDEYAKLALGIEAVPGIALTQHTNYRFYEEYKLVVEAMKKKP